MLQGVGRVQVTLVEAAACGMQQKLLRAVWDREGALGAQRQILRQSL